MLKLSKKEEVKPVEIQSKYSQQYEADEKLLKIVREASHLRQEDIAQHIEQLPSIAASTLAEIIQKIITAVQEDSISESLDFLLRLIAIPHDPRELRHYLKHKFKVDGELLLYLLWERREESGALYLANLAVDCFTAQLMLGDKQVVKLWKNYITRRINYSQSRENLVMRLQQEAGGEKGGKEGFRKLIIPL